MSGGKYIGANLAKYDHRRKQVTFDEIARRLRSAIDEKQVTQSDLARRTGLSISSVQSMVQGTTVALIPLVKVARELGVAVEALVPEEV